MMRGVDSVPAPKEGRPIILAIDSCSLPGSVSLCVGNEMVFERTLETGISQSLTLLKAIDEALQTSGVDIGDVDTFAVSSGPGSFTGLRIGLATVKAFAATCNRPCIGVPTLHATAFSAGVSERTLAMLPAGRGEVFAQILAVTSDGEVIELTDAIHLPPAMVVDRFATTAKLRFAGTGAIENYDALRTKGESEGRSVLAPDFKGGSPDVGGEFWAFCPGPYVLSSSVSKIALKEWLEGRQSDAADLLPNYLRPSDPELKLLCR